MCNTFSLGLPVRDKQKDHPPPVLVRLGQKLMAIDRLGADKAAARSCNGECMAIIGPIKSVHRDRVRFAHQLMAAHSWPVVRSPHRRQANRRRDGRTLRNVPSMASSCERKPWTCSTATRHSRHDAGWTWIPAHHQRGRTWNSNCIHSTTSPSTQPDPSEVEPRSLLPRRRPHLSSHPAPFNAFLGN